MLRKLIVESNEAYNAKDYVKVISLTDEAIALKNDDEDDKANLAPIYLNRSLALKLTHRWAEARTSALTAIDLYRTYKHLFDFSTEESGGGTTTTSLEQKPSSFNQNLASAYVALADVNRMEGHYHESLANVKTAIELDQNLGAAYVTRG